MNRFAATTAAVAIAAALLDGDAVALADGSPEHAALRAAMVENVREYASLAGGPGIDERVMRVLATVPRHEFVPPEQARQAYDNRPLPIGSGQTISQPYIVALMTDLVSPRADDVVLEIGTGSGYQAAVLSHLVEHVYTIEIIEALSNQASARLERLEYDNITTRLGDGYYGWEEHAPYDAIVVTAAASHVPRPLIEQLTPGGRMVIPVGERFATQQLLLIEKSADGGIVTRQIATVRFVPLTGDH